MADWNEKAMKRLDRVEAAITNIATILVEQSERIDGVSERLDGVSERLDGVSERLDGLQGALTERLDRLIAVTIAERTASAERLLEIERRLERLETHVGI